MDKPLEITFRNLDRSEAVTSIIKEKYSHLARFYRHLISLNVKLDMPHRRHRRGNHYRITIEAVVPGNILVASRSSEAIDRHEMPLPTINDAFAAITRKLEDYARIQRDDIKRHDMPVLGRVIELFPEYGFIRLADDREVYFHKNSVVHPGFGSLDVGAPVRVVIAEGESSIGPQASTVEAIHPMDLVDERTSPFKTLS
ncbi:MAG: HPF/RaiA family ribosome-associated protein [Alphaproteobacteria bacterium]|nr:HPF/RaiA family ribosome-associated protein [Alphaproteobacteria bacterium]